MYYYNNKAMSLKETTIMCDKSEIKNTYGSSNLSISSQNFIDSMLHFVNINNLPLLFNTQNYISFDYWLIVDYKLWLLLFNTFISTIILCSLFFSLLAIAERTLRQVSKM